ncbi:MAG: zf-HC2 domain-containing protein [Proteobacteria bacterium]|nr:zf-HC2 domain-containing protein [Pseudomonadota bacterium]
MKSQCPSEEFLNDYLEGRLPTDACMGVETHLAQCDHCRDVISVYDSLRDLEGAPDMMPVPESLTQKAIVSVKKMETSPLSRQISRAVRTVSERVRLFGRHMEWFLAGDPVLVRNGARASSQDVVTVIKVLKGMDASIEIEKCGEAKACLRVDMFSSQTPVPSVRVALFQGQREVASFQAAGKPALFEDIPFGPYVLAFSRKGEHIGEYVFEIRESHHG